MFKDRTDAGIQLADALLQYRGKNAVVLALPRGGVETGFEVARTLELPLDIVSIRKIGHPTSPEYAICAVDEHGTRLCNESAIWDVDEAWLAKETENQTKEAIRRVRVYRAKRPPQAIAGTIAIIVDDGIATGLTMRAAIAAVRARGAKQIIVAVPVASPDAVADLKKEADEVVVLEAPEDFLGAVGSYYTVFEQLSDARVIELLNRDSTTQK